MKPKLSYCMVRGFCRDQTWAAKSVSWLDRWPKELLVRSYACQSTFLGFAFFSLLASIFPPAVFSAKFPYQSTYSVKP